MSAYTSLWAKSDPPHPLWCHLLDVGAVIEAFWDAVLSEGAHRRMARALGLSAGEARILIIFLGALHDIGKAAPQFQFQDEALAAQTKDAGFGISRFVKREPRGAIGAEILYRHLTDTCAWEEKVAHDVTTAIGAHHGIVEGIDQRLFPSQGIWHEAHHDLIAMVETAFGLGDISSVRPGHLDRVGLCEIAGLISYCDWIGSASEYFTQGDYVLLFTGVISVEEYVTRTRENAKRALRESGWRRTPSMANRDWGGLFGDGFAPNELQRTGTCQ